jgi:hypothetical protein
MINRPSAPEVGDDLTATFRNRYALECFSDGDGVVVDLETGSYFRINRTSLVICKALQASNTTTEAIQQVASTLKITTPQAVADVNSVRANLVNGLEPEKPPGPLYYKFNPDGSAFLIQEDRVIFSVDANRRTVGLVDLPTALPLSVCLRSLMPKLLAILDVPVLHAAACQIDNTVLGLSGKSGAGKTTTVRAFAQAGATLISEDLLVLSLRENEVRIFTKGEEFGRLWTQEMANRLETAGGKELDFTELRGAPCGMTLRLNAIWLLEATRRIGTNIQLRVPSIGDAVVALLGNGFLATSSHSDWREFLRRSRKIAEQSHLTEVTMPSGLDPLADAARRYITKLAS